MTNSSPNPQLGIVRSAAVISLGMVALAGSIAATLFRRMTTPAKSRPADPKVSKMVMDEWEADLARLGLPTRNEVEALNRQIAVLEAQIDQLAQTSAQSKNE